MTIDIIDLTDPDYKNLSPVQLAMVRAAQVKKDKITAEAEAAAQAATDLFVMNGWYRSTVRRDRLLEIATQRDKDIEVVREDLKYQLAYEALGSEGNENGPYRYPQNPNYNLSYAQRFLVVRQYYMEITDDPEARLKAFAMDSLARQYLGEYYQTLYDLLQSYC